MKQCIITSILIILTSCAPASNNIYIPPEQPATASTVAPQPLQTTDAEIAQVVSEFNSTRLAEGQDPVTAGLACSLYTVPGTTTQIIGANLTGVGCWTYTDTFNYQNSASSPGLGILPVSIQSNYTSYYIIKCVGYLIVTDGGFYNFSLSSDDGSNLYVNGGLLINNDGIHAVTTKTAAKFLARGSISFELDYFDVGGDHALILLENGLPVPTAIFYH